MIITLSEPLHPVASGLYAPTTSGIPIRVLYLFGYIVLDVAGVAMASSSAIQPLTSHEEVVTWASKLGVQIIVAPQGSP